MGKGKGERVRIDYEGRKKGEGIKAGDRRREEGENGRKGVDGTGEVFVIPFTTM